MGYKEGGVPARFEAELGPDKSVSIWGDEYRFFHESVLALRGEPLTEHLPAREVETELWDLVCELTIRRSRYRQERDLVKAIDEFVERVLRPWAKFEVAFVLRDLSVEVDGFSIVDARFERWAQIPDDWSIGQSQIEEEFRGANVAIVSLDAGSKEQASSRARERVEEALHVLRLAVISSGPIRVDDSEVAFATTGMEIVRAQANSSRSVRWDYRSSIPLRIDANSVKQMDLFLSTVAAVLTSDETSEQVKTKIGIAARWIGAAATRRDYDDKVMAICTALEAMFTVKSDRRKAEAVAVRAMLLQLAVDGFFDTFALYRLYLKRSDVTHASTVGVCGAEDYRLIQEQAIRLLQMICTYAAARPGRKFQAFLDDWRSAGRLLQARNWFSRYGRDGSDIVRAIDEMLLGQTWRGRIADSLRKLASSVESI
jgi:hypothetical protein